MTTDPAPSAEGGSKQPATPKRNLRKVGMIVDHRLGGPLGLQQAYLDKKPYARASLAHLRKGVSSQPGDLPELWELTSIKVPDLAGDAPTYEEIAVYTAMTLYGVHQQSKQEGMFKPGFGLGHAARRLIGTDDDTSARDRFNALATAGTISELRYHLRTFVSLLRARGIPLDYAMLADDIAHFQYPGNAKSVRLRWARQYAILPSDTSDNTADPEASNTTKEN
ncbi:type I-E CRISPR-associated protein Cse2/CasB [Arcanobacterium haemolyticum]|nr:type I-E CRISPR-associated protein Cse2/CasB [Arcanobacterium haemolyticum]